MPSIEHIQSRLVLMTGWRRLALAAALGAVSALSMAPFHLFVVNFITFPALIWLLDGAIGTHDGGARKRFRMAFAIGWAFGFGYFLAGMWWIANALLVEAAQFAWLIPLAVCALPSVLAIFIGLACGLARLFWSDGLARIAVFAACFGLAELARAHVATGLPWNAIGYALAPDAVLMQSASLFGISGLNYLAAFVFALPAAMVGPGTRAIPVAALVALIIAAHGGYGVWRLASNPVPLATDDQPVVRLVQPAIDQSVKTGGDALDRQFDILLDLTTEPGTGAIRSPDVIIWPETAVPFILTRAPEAVAAIADRLTTGQVLLTGAVREEGDVESGAERRYTNAIIALDDQGVITGAADKVHLVPFGEYLPFKGLLETIGLRAIAAADRGYVGASSRNAIAAGDYFAVQPLICYEAIFPRHAGDGLTENAVMVVVSNDAWYGNTPGPYQHSHQARLRAVEFGRPMLRAANSGISSAHDAFGRPVVDPLPLGVRAAVDLPLSVVGTPTLYSGPGAYYHWLFFGVLFTWGVFASGRARRQT